MVKVQIFADVHPEGQAAALAAVEALMVHLQQGRDPLSGNDGIITPNRREQLAAAARALLAEQTGGTAGDTTALEIVCLSNTAECPPGAAEVREAAAGLAALDASIAVSVVVAGAPLTAFGGLAVFPLVAAPSALLEATLHNLSRTAGATGIVLTADQAVGASCIAGVKRVHVDAPRAHLIWVRAVYIGPASLRPVGSPRAQAALAAPVALVSPLGKLCAGVATGALRSMPVAASAPADVVPMDVALACALLCLVLRPATAGSLPPPPRSIKVLGRGPTALVWGMAVDAAQDYLLRFQDDIVAAMPGNIVPRDPNALRVSFEPHLADAWYMGGSLAAPIDFLLRPLAGGRAAATALEDYPHSAAANRIRALRGTVAEVASVANPVVRQQLERANDDSYASLMRAAAARGFAPCPATPADVARRALVRALTRDADVAAVQWEMYTKHVARSSLAYIAARVVREPLTQPLPQPVPLWLSDVIFSGTGTPPRNAHWLRRTFVASQCAMHDGRQPNGHYVPIERGNNPLRVQAILAQPNVQLLIARVADETRAAREQVQGRAEKILRGIADTSNHKQMRTMIWLLRCSLQQILTGLELNLDDDSWRSLWRAFHRPRTCVVVVPHHRSYMDFTAASYLSLIMGLEPPHVCAGEDFLKLGPVADFMRGSGAFFMRRSFRTDKLYAQLFREYVRSLVRAGRPLEFFIEGMRSRGGRTLAPKMGFLKMVTDSFFEPQAEVDDVVVLPLSITYDRLLEHDLYARELLGIPKPPENVANLLRSVTILGNNYGAVNLRFGAVLSLRDTAERFKGSVEKARVAALAKGTQAFTPGDLLEDFAGAITRRLDERTVVTPSALVSAALLFLNDTRLLSSGAGVPLETLTGQIESLRDAALRCGATMSDRFHDATAGALFEYARPLLAPHVRVRDGLVRVGPDATSSFMVHAIYANQLAYLLAPVGVLAVAAASEPEDAAALRARAQGGLKTLAVEFPSFLGLEKHRDPFAEGVDLLRRADGDRAATTTEGKITVARGPFGTAGARLVNATVESYYVAALVCAALAGKPEVQEKSLLKVARSAALDLYAAELLDFPQCANQETLRNGLAAARQHGVLKTTGAVGVVVAESTPDAALGYAAQLALWRRSAATPEQMQQAVKIVQDIAARASTVSAKL